MTVGQRVRLWRKRRGLTQKELAELAGLSLSLVEKVEIGIRALDNKAHRAAIANALRVPLQVLLGQPYDPIAYAHQLADAHVLDVRRVLMEITSGGSARASKTRRSIDEIEADVESVARMRHVPDWAGQMRMLPDLLRELAGLRTRRSRILFLDALYSTANALKFLGHLDLATLASLHAVRVAEDLSEPAWLGFAGFTRAHAMPAECPDIAATLAVESASSIKLSDRDPDTLSIYGHLHLTAGLLFATARDRDTSTDHLAEGSGLARDESLTGGFAFLQFGPSNAARYRMKAQLELSNYGKALATAKQAAHQRTPFLQASYHIAAGRALHHLGRDVEAITELDKAERVAPQLVHVSPSARTTVETILTKRSKPSDAAFARDLAERMGMFANHHNL